MRGKIYMDQTEKRGGRKRLRHLICGGLILLFLAICFSVSTPPNFGGMQPVQAFLINPSRLDESEPSIGHWHILDEAPKLSPDQIKRIRNVLSSHLTYGGWPPLCFNPRLGFRLFDGKETIDVLVCLECSQIDVIHGDAHHYYALNPLGEHRFQSISDELFPNAKVKLATADAASEAEYRRPSTTPTSVP
jgi:hypothetical protein